MTATVRAPAQSTGQVPGPVRATLLVVEGLWTWYRRHWRSTLVSSVLQPLLYLVAMGVGLGTFVDAGGRGARTVPELAGASYLQYIAPALLVAAALQNAAGEATYPVLSGFKWQKNYWAVTATPITPHQLAHGSLLWIAIRVAVSGAAYLLVAALLGAVAGPGALLALPVAVLTAMAFAAPLAAFAATTRSGGEGFNVIIRFVVLPMTLFAGTFFPVEQLPALVRPLAWVTPLWHGTELARGLSLTGVPPLAALGHVGYLVVWLAVGVVVTRWRFRVRLTT
ncbi:ABC transporter permease [Streptoalloteichus hindustanus]|uniref:Transport permease protein n=1 Tax=Streptoalloteichus hindustanus TaxID=2017 RepID=A0A1M5BPC6_STRHI|nr:ABC transporter permease [Streptoalloteichus hindustanus]SHF44246.1 lipooligosaccharide transport system permease protein [Streptoalloteichus hindustanus]